MSVLLPFKKLLLSLNKIIAFEEMFLVTLTLNIHQPCDVTRILGFLVMLQYFSICALSFTACSVFLLYLDDAMHAFGNFRWLVI